MPSSHLKWPNKADCAFAIRDDDISYFTKPRQLEVLYRDAWEMGFKTSFAVIPNIRGTNNLNVPPSFRGNLKYYPIRENDKIVFYLKSKIANGTVDILQHGFCHSENSHLPTLRIDLNKGELVSDQLTNINLKIFSEFYSLDEKECSRRVKEGRRLIEETFNIRVRVFVPPQEYLSKNLWKCLKGEGMYILGGFDHRVIPFWDFNLPKLLILAYSKFAKKEIYPEDLFDVSKVPYLGSSYKHYLSKYLNEKVAEYWFKKVKEIFQNCLKRRSVFILHTHYWEYFYDWHDEISQTRMLEYLYQILEYVDQFNIWKCKITELFQYLRQQ
jgi:hypothetical protein